MTRQHGGPAILAALLVIVNACASTTRVGPAMQERAWRVYLGSASRAGAAHESLAADPQPVWRADLGRGIIGAPAVTEDLVAAAQVDRQVAVLDRATGDVIWRRRLPANLGTGPLLADDRLFAATQGPDGRVYALRLTNGRTLWSAEVGDVVAPLVVEGGAVYAATTRGWVERLEASGRGRVWRARVSGAVRAAPTLVGTVLAVATTTDSLFVLDSQTGEVRSRRPTAGAVLAAPAVADSVLVIGTSTGKLEALDPTTLEPRWSLQMDGPVVGHVAVREGTVYALANVGTLWVVPMDRPESARRVNAGLVPRAGPAPIAGGVLVCGVTGEVAWLDRGGGRRWSARLEAPVVEPPVVDGRTILTVSQRGEVVAFR